MSFDTYYSDNPWSGFTQNQRSVYWPELLDTFRVNSVYRPFVRYVADMAAQRTQTIYFDELYDTEPDVDAIGNRDIWLASRHLDSRRVSITMEHHGDKIALHKFDRLVTFWRQNGGDLSAMCRGKLGINMVDYLDILVRNAIIDAPFKLYSGTASNFNTLSADYDPSDGQKIWKSMANMNVPFAKNVNPSSNPGALVAITSPTVVFDIQDHDDSTKWVDLMQYSRPEVALNYEVGQWTGVRYLQTGRNILHNCGGSLTQQTLQAAVSAGDGAYTGTVDGVYDVGQTGATGYITVSDGTAFSVGDVITVHKTRTSSYGVTNGVDPTAGVVRQRRIVNIDGHNLGLDKPLLDDFTTSHYVSKATDVHMTAFIAGPNAVAAGVAQAPQVYAPPAVDDMMAIQRFTWDAYMKFQLFRTEYLAVVFSAGSDNLAYTFS